LREKIVKGGGERKLQTVVEQRTCHEASVLTAWIRRDTLLKDSVVLGPDTLQHNGSEKGKHPTDLGRRGREADRDEKKRESKSRGSN
jgi:hypothetical protein